MSRVRFRFAYDGPEGAPFEVPDRHAPALREAPGGPADPEAVGRALADVDVFEGRRRVLILVDDGTRGTRADLVLPHLDRALREARVPDDHVRVLTAQGTHRRMTRGELAAKLGPFVDRWQVHQHDWRAADEHVRLGETRGGMPIVVNRLLTESDLVLGIGHVGVHAIMGFSGGAKIVHPGVSGGATEAWTHWTANYLEMERLLGDPEGPIRKEIEEGARVAGLAAVVNLVQDAEGGVHHAAFGDHVKAHRACAAASRALHETRLGGPVDVVVADSRPADRDYWQSAKGLYCASVAVKEGGSIVLASPNPEGVADNHPDLLRLAGLPLEVVRQRVEAGDVEDVVAAAVAALTARIRERASVHLVSGGVRPEEAHALGFRPHATPQDAVDAALAEQGPDASVAVLRGAGNLLPLVRGRNDHLLRTREA